MGSLLERYGWYEWLCHTNFSFLIGGSHPDEYVTRATREGYAGLAITDYDGVYGIARAYRARRQIIKNKEDTRLHLFYGAEVHFAQDHHIPLVFQDTATFIAQSRQGYFNLCRLLSYAHREGKHNAYVPFDDVLARDMQDVVCLIPMRGLIRCAKRHEELLQRLLKMREVFNGRIYLCVGRYLNPAEDMWIKPMLELARASSLPVILSQDVYFHEANQKDVCDVLQAMRLNRVVDDVVEHLFVNAERHLHALATLEERYKVFPFYETSLQASRQLAESCEFKLDELRYYYPKEMIPEGYSAQTYLESLVWDSAQQRYGEIPERIAHLLKKELTLIKDLQFADYFLTVWDIVRWAREQDILCQGRGSAANSAVCFMLGITPVDPSLHDLLFERFISVERGDPPDIDVDFEHERREEVIQYIYERYGRGKAAMVANVVTLRSRGVSRFVGKALGIPENMLDKVSCTHERGDLWLTLAHRIKGFPRHLGIHAGGFMISDRPLDWLVAQEPATMPGRSVVQWCKEDIEALGFFKIDILALGMLTAVRKTFALMREHYGRQMTMATVPAEDADTYAMIQKADTVGTFQIESRAQMSMLPRLKPKTFYDLVIEVAIIRPGPIQGGLIHPYLKRRFGQEPVTYAHPSLVPILERTLGMPLFQEQVMRVAMAIGDFTPGEADELRRNMGAWQIKGDLGPWIERFKKGMRAKGINETFVEQMVGQFKGFADYGFPESHAVSFALIAYVSSYLKAHYPVAFCVALLNSQPMGFYSPNALLRDAMRQGIQILPVCAMKSDWQAKLEATSLGRRLETNTYAIRLGLSMIRGLRQTSADKFIARRKTSADQWNDIYEFLQGSELSRPDLTALAAANALSVFGVDRRASLWLAEAAPFAPYLEDEDLVQQFPDESPLQMIQSDFYATGTTLGRHPTLVIREHYWCFSVGQEKLMGAAALKHKNVNPKEPVYVFGMVLVRQAPGSAKGMVFFTLEDETGFINLVFTPPVFARFRDIIDGQGFLCVRGILQRQGETHSILVNQVYTPEIPKAEVLPMRHGMRPKILKSESSKLPTDEVVSARNYM